ncbi:MAG: LPS export ABC transporter ATP-binding protein [Pseudomonadota bacterium]
MSFVDRSVSRLARGLDTVLKPSAMLVRWGLLRPRDPLDRLEQNFDRLIADNTPRLGVKPSNGHTDTLNPLFDENDTYGGQTIVEHPIIGDALVVQGLRKAYKGRVVVRDAGLTVKRGEAVGLLGPNGAGKTTIFYMITGLVLPDAGQIHLDGYDITRLPMYQRARLGIGYLPQEASIFRGLTVEENIMAVLELVEPDVDKRHADLDDLLDEFQITALRKAPAISLSGGERRRCEIARALASRPAFMLLDEPFAGVDPIAVGDIRALVRHLTTRGIGVLITDHNVRETLSLIDRATIIHSGTVLTEGTPDAIVANTEARRLYLGESFSL